MTRSLAGAFLAVSALLGQQAPPGFEVASVKASTDRDNVIGMFTHPGGRVTATRYTLKMLIHEAYAIEDYRILGGPHWADTDLYNLEAKPPHLLPRASGFRQVSRARRTRNCARCCRRCWRTASS